MTFSQPYRYTLSFLLAVTLIFVLVAFAGSDLLDVIKATDRSLLLTALILSTTTYPVASLRWWIISNHLAGARVDSFLGFLRARVTLGLGGLVGPREIVETGGRAVWSAKFRQQTAN